MKVSLLQASLVKWEKDFLICTQDGAMPGKKEMGKKSQNQNIINLKGRKLKDKSARGLSPAVSVIWQ